MNISIMAGAPLLERSDVDKKIIIWRAGVDPAGRLVRDGFRRAA